MSKISLSCGDLLLARSFQTRMFNFKLFSFCYCVNFLSTLEVYREDHFVCECAIWYLQQAVKKTKTASFRCSSFNGMSQSLFTVSESLSQKKIISSKCPSCIYRPVLSEDLSSLSACENLHNTDSKCSDPRQEAGS